MTGMSHKIQRDVSCIAFIIVSALTTPAWAVDCLIEPIQVIELASPVSGLVENTFVKRADIVTKGQVVATLESGVETALLALDRFKAEQVGPKQIAENKIAFAKRKYYRRQQMAREHLMTTQDRDDAEADLRIAESELKVALENQKLADLEYQQHSQSLKLRTLRSPFDGVVVEQLAYPGEVVEPGSEKKSIYKLAQLDPLQIHVVLPKSAFGKVIFGMPVDVFPDIPPGKRYSARVKSIDRVIDAASGSFVVLLELPNPQLDISVGTQCKAIFPTTTGLSN
jgi:RND family efflux transporter MFP subunit